MGLPTVGSPWLWAAFCIFIVVMLVIDLGVFNRRAHTISIKEASIWSVIWIVLALAFGAFVFVQWGSELGQAYLTGYLIEKALSVDNLFVFYAIFSAFAVAPQYQHRLLTLGIVGALLMRAVMVFGGSWLIQHFEWVLYVFGALLVWSGGKMLMRPEAEPHPEESRVYKLVRKIIPTTDQNDGQRLFTIENGVHKATPLFLVLLMIEASDLIFAIDSILAVFAISRDPFIVFTSNIFAVMGLRALYFVLAGMARRFQYLQPGLALVLVFVGLKMVVSDWIHIPVLASLGVIVTLLAGSIVASIVKRRRDASDAPPASGATAA